MNKISINTADIVTAVAERAAYVGAKTPPTTLPDGTFATDTTTFDRVSIIEPDYPFVRTLVADGCVLAESILAPHAGIGCNDDTITITSRAATIAQDSVKEALKAYLTTYALVQWLSTCAPAQAQAYTGTLPTLASSLLRSVLAPSRPERPKDYPY